MRKLKEYERHVFSDRDTNILKQELLKKGVNEFTIEKTKRAFCGAVLDYERLHFPTADDAIYNNMAQARQLPCPECRKKMVEYLLEGTNEIKQPKEELLDAIHNLMGIIDSPIGRLKMKGDILEEAKDIAIAILESNQRSYRG